MRKKGNRKVLSSFRVCDKMSGTVFDSFLLYMEADMKYKCLIFDLDGTLVNSIHALTYCTNLSLEKFGLGPSDEDDRRGWI